MTHADGGARSAAPGVSWAVATATAYSLSAIVGKTLLADLGVASLLFWRFVVASAVLWGWMALRRPVGGRRPHGVGVPTALAIGAGFGGLVHVGFLSLERLDASVYIVLVYLYPVIVVVATSLLGQRATALTWLALALVVIGVVMTVPEIVTGGATTGGVDPIGVALALGQAVLFAGFIIVNSRVVPAHADGVVTAAWTVLGAALVLSPVAVWQGIVVPDSGRLVAEVAMFALVPTVLANVFFFRAMRVLAPAIVAMVLTLEVALAILWSSLFLGERLRIVQYGGALVVVASVLLAQSVALRESRPTGRVVAEPV